MPLVAIPASGAPRAAERLLIRAFAQSTSATTDRGISLGSASKQSARANLVERSTREAVWVDPNSATQRDLFVSNSACVDQCQSRCIKPSRPGGGGGLVLHGTEVPQQTDVTGRSLPNCDVRRCVRLSLETTPQYPTLGYWKSTARSCLTLFFLRDDSCLSKRREHSSTDTVSPTTRRWPQYHRQRSRARSKRIEDCLSSEPKL
jgi:hypothetical protein